MTEIERLLETLAELNEAKSFRDRLSAHNGETRSRSDLHTELSVERNQRRMFEHAACRMAEFIKYVGECRYMKECAGCSDRYRELMKDETVDAMMLHKGSGEPFVASPNREKADEGVVRSHNQSRNRRSKGVRSRKNS